jgi:uncharacterized membrane protein (DUF106 family)
VNWKTQLDSIQKNFIQKLTALIIVDWLITILVYIYLFPKTNKTHTDLLIAGLLQHKYLYVKNDK